jgi:TonB family protein
MFMRLASLIVASLFPLFAQGQSDGDVQAFVPNLTPLKRIAGVLPEAARSQGLQGVVRLLVTIDAQGLATNVEPLTGPEILRQPAIDAVRKKQFRPVIRNGHPVTAYTDENVGFYIPGKPVVVDFKEEHAAIQRIMDLEKRFPRSKQQVLTDLEQDISGADSRQRFYALRTLAKAAWEAGAILTAADYATELLNDVAQNPRDWNDGNAIHDGHMVLGLVALSNGNLGQAGKDLLEAGKTPGSPQLDSFGPNMTLAKELLQKGEKDVVLEYFALCRVFWKMGNDRLDEWTAMVRGGGMPKFGANLVY